MTASIKNLIGGLAFMAILFTVACTKEAIDDLTADATIVAVDELVVLGDPMGSPDSVRTPRDSSRCWKGGHGNHPSRVKGDSIGFSSLPTAAQTYLNTNTTVANIKRIVRITLPDGTVQYTVRFNDGTHLHFDAAGEVITTSHHKHNFVRITLTDLPAAAQTYLNTNTTVANIVGIIKVTKPDGTITYGVRFSDDKRLTFDAAGAVIPNPVGGRRKRR